MMVGYDLSGAKLYSTDYFACASLYRQTDTNAHEHFKRVSEFCSFVFSH